MKKYVLAGFCALVLAGCTCGCASMSARVPPKAITSPKTDNTVVYFTARSSIPKDALYRPYIQQVVSSNGKVTTQAIPPEVLTAVIGMIPELSGSVLQVRKDVVLTDVELYLSGSNITPEVISQALRTLRPPIDSAAQ